MPTSFIKSTIDRCQSNFSGFFFAKSLRMAATSTTGGATAVAGAAGVCDCWAGAGAYCVCVPGAAAGAELAWLKISDIRLLNSHIVLLLPLVFQFYRTLRSGFTKVSRGQSSSI